MKKKVKRVLLFVLCIIVFGVIIVSAATETRIPPVMAFLFMLMGCITGGILVAALPDQTEINK